MNSRRRNIFYIVTGVVVISVFMIWFYGEKEVSEPVKINGQTMGTTYHITYFDAHNRDFKIAIDSILLAVNKAINTYDSTSEISHFNSTAGGIAIRLPYLFPLLQKAQEVYHSSHGSFDLTVMPLVNAWGFGPGKQLNPDRATIDSMLTFVGFEKIHFTVDSITKRDSRVQLDFGGIGQGYGADVIIDFLRSEGITDMLVELGGEGMACGKNLKSGKAWEIGILDPNATYEDQFFKAYVSLSGRSFTTSGNYFNYREIDGIKYSHTISPQSGFPVQHALLSASVFAEDCATADAWATAFMVMGHEKAIALLKLHPELDALLIYNNSAGMMETFATQGISASLRIEPNQK